MQLDCDDERASTYHANDMCASRQRARACRPGHLAMLHAGYPVLARDAPVAACGDWREGMTVPDLSGTVIARTIAGGGPVGADDCAERGWGPRDN